MNHKVISAYLFLAALVGIYVGGSLLFFPAELQAQSDILITSPSQYSEARAPGAAIVSASIIALLGAFKAQWRKTALIVMTLFFTSYGLGRLMSLVLDGMPAEGLFYAMIGEIIMGVVAYALLLKVNNAEKMAAQ